MTAYTQELTEIFSLRGFFINPFKEVSTNGGYMVLKDEKTLLASVLSNLSEALEKQKSSKIQTQILLTYDSTNSKYAFSTITKR